MVTVPDGLGFAGSAERVGVGDTRADAVAEADGDGRRDAGTGRWAGVVDATTCGALAGAVCGAVGELCESTSRMPRPPLTAKKVPVADAAIPLATAIVVISRRGLRRGAQMLSPSGGTWPRTAVMSGSAGRAWSAWPVWPAWPRRPNTGQSLDLDSAPDLERWSRS